MQKETRLKSKQEYIDLYDRITVEDCRRREKFHTTYGAPEGEPYEESKKKMGMLNELALYFDILYATGYWWENKEKKINEWMERDRVKDELYDSAQAPDGIRCLQCRSLMQPTFKDLYDWGSDNTDRVLFMYDCPNNCPSRRAFFDNGEEWRPKSKPCPRCQSALEEKDRARKENKITWKDTCSQCGYAQEEELDLTPKEEIPDEDFPKDRERFCLDEEGGKKYLEEKAHSARLGNVVDSWEEREKNEELYAAVEKIKKLTIAELENLLGPLAENAGYARLEFAKPEIGKDMVVAFTVQDGKSERGEYDSTQGMKKLIDSTLAGTNWRLMTDGLSYRLGFLSGRLKGVEGETALRELAAKDIKRNNPKNFVERHETA